jgi:hypothetical protein
MLTVHTPSASALKYPAHPPSAPSATHWAGPTRVLGIDEDKRYSHGTRFVGDLAVNLSTRPCREATVQSVRASPCAMQRENFQDDGGAVPHGNIHNPSRDDV